LSTVERERKREREREREREIIIAKTIVKISLKIIQKEKRF